MFDPDTYWTAIILCPPGFFWRSPLHSEMDNTWQAIGKQDSELTAEITCILYALRAVADRWAVLNDYVENLLSEDFFGSQILC